MLIFQFTLPREERRQVQAQPLTLQNFNPRSHERSDFLPVKEVISVLISIHAPTRGATSLFGVVSDFLGDFNPRSHERSDGGFFLMITLYSDFNPRSHERSDSRRRALGCQLFVFQSTLPREERRFL